MAQYTGALHASQVYDWLYNLILSVETFSKNLGGSFGSLKGALEQDIGRFGDSKVFVGLDVPFAKTFTQNNYNDANVLNTNPAKGISEIVSIDDFKRVFTTTCPQGFESMAFGSEFYFSDFITAVLATLAESKRVEQDMRVNTFVGCCEAGATTGTAQQQELDLSGLDDAGVTMAIAAKVADIQSDMAYPSRDYNDAELLRSYDPDQFIIVWNDKYVHRMQKVGMPVIYNADKVAMDFKYKLKASLFGDVVATSGTGDGATYRAYKSFVYTTGSGANAVEHYVIPGSIIPNGVAFEAGYAYIDKETAEEEEVICKIIEKKKAIVCVTGMDLRTTWTNPANRNSENNYLYMGMGIDKLDQGAVVTLKKKA